jgi:hypothetical protein
MEVAMAGDAAKLVELAPSEAARALVEQADEAWLAELQLSLDRELAHPGLERILAVWDLSQADAARLFGVTRQAIGKWLAQGPPAGRAGSFADLGAATDLLVRHLKRDRIPAVVRRPSSRLGGRSLLEVAAAGRTRELLLACREMFAFGDAHA